MNDPLPLAHNWRMRLVAVSAILLVVLVMSLMLGDKRGWLLMMFVVTLAVFYLAGLWFTCRASLQLGDDALLTRTALRTHRVEASSIREVRDVFNGRSPDVALILEGGRRVRVPASRLQGGHSELFDWLAEKAPQAELNEGAQRIVEKIAEVRNNGGKQPGIFDRGGAK